MRKHILIFIFYILLLSCNKSTSELKPIEEPCYISTIKISNSANVLDYDFKFDKNSNILKLTVKSQGNGKVRTRKYVYDSNNRLIETSGPLEFSGPNISENFKYDLLGRIIEYRNHYPPVGIVISKYIYKDNFIEKYKYKNEIADSNLLEIDYYSIDSKQNVTKHETYLVNDGQKMQKNLTTRTYNSKGQLLIVNDNSYSSITSITRYEYDSFDNIKIYYKPSDHKEEYLQSEFLNFSPVPEPKRTFKEWQLGLEEPFKFGIKISKWGTNKTYDTFSKLLYIQTRKLAYDANQFLVKDEISIQYADGSGSKGSCSEWAFTCSK